MSSVHLIIALGSLLSVQSPVAAADVRFASPTGNITCTINQFAAACQLTELSATFTDPPADCDGDWGRYFYVVARQSGQVGCVTQNTTTPASILEYGQSIQAGTLMCVSRRTGVTCRNSAGGGFTVRRSEQRLF